MIIFCSFFCLLNKKMSKMIIFLKILIFLTKRHTFTNLYITPHFYTKKVIFEHFCEWGTKNTMRNLLCNTCLRMSAVCATQQCWIKYLRTQLCEELYIFITYVNSALINVHIAQIRIKMCKSHNIHTFFVWRLWDFVY